MDARCSGSNEWAKALDYIVALYQRYSVAEVRCIVDGLRVARSMQRWADRLDARRRRKEDQPCPNASASSKS